MLIYAELVVQSPSFFHLLFYPHPDSYQDPKRGAKSLYYILLITDYCLLPVDYADLNRFAQKDHGPVFSPFYRMAYSPLWLLGLCFLS